jgi:hypothetical protein
MPTQKTPPKPVPGHHNLAVLAPFRVELDACRFSILHGFLNGHRLCLHRLQGFRVQGLGFRSWWLPEWAQTLPSSPAGEGIIRSAVSKTHGMKQVLAGE